MPRKALATVALLLLLTAPVAAFVLVRSGGAAPGSTPKATFRDRDGDGVLERAHGEALVDRTEIGPRSRPAGPLRVPAAGGAERAGARGHGRLRRRASSAGRARDGRPDRQRATQRARRGARDP